MLLVIFLESLMFDNLVTYHIHKRDPLSANDALDDALAETPPEKPEN